MIAYRDDTARPRDLSYLGHYDPQIQSIALRVYQSAQLILSANRSHFEVSALHIRFMESIHVKIVAMFVRSSRHHLLSYLHWCALTRLRKKWTARCNAYKRRSSVNLLCRANPLLPSAKYKSVVHLYVRMVSRLGGCSEAYELWQQRGGILSSGWHIHRGNFKRGDKPADLPV
jgi:hypothetical protein